MSEIFSRIDITRKLMLRRHQAKIKEADSIVADFKDRMDEVTEEMTTLRIKYENEDRMRA